MTGNAVGAGAKSAPNLKEEIKMQELTMNEVEQVDGGSPLVTVAAVLMAPATAVGVAVVVGIAVGFVVVYWLL